MNTPTRRSANRVTFGVPVQIYTADGYVNAHLCDISRTGMRLRLRAGDLKVERIADLESTAQAVGRTLASNFSLDLDYKKLGPLLQHTVALARIGIPADEPLKVDVCCTFDEPVGDEEAAILGTALPPMPGTNMQWVAPRSVPKHCEGIVRFRPTDLVEGSMPTAPARPGAPVEAPIRHKYRALVTGLAKNAPPSFFCHTNLVTAVGVRVTVPRPVDAINLTAAMKGLVRIHSEGVQLRILDGNEDVWEGPARVTGVELPSDRLDSMHVTLAFDAPLTMSSMRRLGLLSPAA